MKQLFASATIKLTGWYLLILTVICLLFSIVIYHISAGELRARLTAFETRFENMEATNEANASIALLRDRQLKTSEINLFFALFYANIAIILLGGVGSYALARRSLRPIEASHEAQSRFTSDASHELRTPLAVMKSELEVALREDSLSKDEMRELLESNLEEVNRLTVLSQTLLQLSRHESTTLDMKKILLNDLVKNTVKVHSLDRSRLILKLPKRRLYIQGNEESVKELLMLILDNALRYSPERSPVTVVLSNAKNGIFLTIQNTGEGINKDDLPYIFERFYRGDKSRTNGASSGFGLGLSLAKKIADIHGAVIEISSIPHEITTVAIIFPLYTKKA